MGRVMRRLVPTLVAAFSSLALAAPAWAVILYVNPSATQAEVDGKVASLAPGDELVFASGDYSGITLQLQLQGTAQAPITIRGAFPGPRPRIIANADLFQEPVRFLSGSSHVIIEQLHLTMTGSLTQSGVRFDDDVHDVTIRCNEISDINGIGIDLELKNDVHDILFEDNHVHHTGMNVSDPNNAGSGFSAGAFSGSTSVTGVHDLVLRGNVVHDTQGQDGNCMRFLYGVYDSIMQDNVVYACPRGATGTSPYALLSVGTGAAWSGDLTQNNILRRNLVVDSIGPVPGTSYVAIYAGSGTTVANNVVVNADHGIVARPEGVPMRNLRVNHNTVYGAEEEAFSMIADGADSTVIVANNVFLTSSPAAFGYRFLANGGVPVIESNYYTGSDLAELPASAMAVLTASLAETFVNASGSIPGADFMPLPTGPLVDVGSNVVSATKDFDQAPRPFGSARDIGAYEWRTDLSDHRALDLGPPACTSAPPQVPGLGGPSLVVLAFVHGVLGWLALLRRRAGRLAAARRGSPSDAPPAFGPG